MNSSRIVAAGLGVTHLLFAVSLLLEPQRFFNKPIHPQLFSIFHLSVFTLLMLRRDFEGGLTSLAVLSYYSLLVKPIAPIAEPQSVGLIGPSLFLVLQSINASRKNSARIIGKEQAVPSFATLLLRLGIAYPFLEWGLDALRNPGAFYSYISTNLVAAEIAQLLGLETVVLLLGLSEIVLATSVSLGIATRVSSGISLSALILFSAAAGYPLALPQDLALAACAVHLMRRGARRFSLDSLFSMRDSEKASSFS